MNPFLRPMKERIKPYDLKWLLIPTLGGFLTTTHNQFFKKLMNKMIGVKRKR